MRRNQSNLPSRQDWQGSLSPFGQSDFLSPSSFTASPWQMMRRMQEDMDRAFGQFFGGPATSGSPGQSGQAPAIQQWSPSIDISQDGKEWCIEADLPGVKPDDIDVQIQNDYLILRAELRPEETAQGPGGQTTAGQPTEEKHNGQQQAQQSRQYHHRERRWGYFERVLPLPENVDEENVSCDFKDGVLTVHLPKSEPKAEQGRRIPVGAGQGQAASGQATGSSSGQKAMTGAKGGEASAK